MTEEIELLPCPFCDESNPQVCWVIKPTDTSDYEFGVYPNPAPPDAQYYIECSCGFETGEYATADIIINRWNTRTSGNPPTVETKCDSTPLSDSPTSNK